jgi:hypothetical protein
MDAGTMRLLSISTPVIDAPMWYGSSRLACSVVIQPGFYASHWCQADINPLNGQAAGLAVRHNQHVDYLISSDRIHVQHSDLLH